MSTGYDVSIPGNLSTIETDTNGAVKVLPYPDTRYNNSMCLLEFQGVGFEAVRSGDHLTTIIYRYQGNIDGLFRKLRRSYAKGEVSINCVE